MALQATIPLHVCSWGIRFSLFPSWGELQAPSPKKSEVGHGWQPGGGRSPHRTNTPWVQRCGLATLLSLPHHCSQDTAFLPGRRKHTLGRMAPGGGRSPHRTNTPWVQRCGLATSLSLPHHCSQDTAFLPGRRKHTLGRMAPGGGRSPHRINTPWVQRCGLATSLSQPHHCSQDTAFPQEDGSIH